MTKFTIALREIGTYKEVLRSQVCLVFLSKIAPDDLIFSGGRIIFVISSMLMMLVSRSLCSISLWITVYVLHVDARGSWAALDISISFC